MTILEDPLNLIVCGIGGQGNVLLSRLIGRALVKKGYLVIISDTFGATQRGGPVMSQIRISKERTYGPLVPQGKAHIILSLEPMETLRVLGDYGNPRVFTISNFYPLYPVEVSMGQSKYPGHKELKEAVHRLSRSAWFVAATPAAIDLGTPVVTNVIMGGVLIGADQLPLNAENMRDVIRDSFSPHRVELNLKAFEIGLKLAQKSIKKEGDNESNRA